MPTKENPAGPGRFALKSIISNRFNEVVQIDHLKMCKSRKETDRILVMIDHFTKYAEAVPCAPHEMTAEATVAKLLNAWFSRHGTPSMLFSLIMEHNSLPQ